MKNDENRRSLLRFILHFYLFIQNHYQKHLKILRTKFFLVQFLKAYWRNNHPERPERVEFIEN